MKTKNFVVFSTALVILLLDQFTKFLIRQNFQLNQSLPITKNIFHLTYITNTGSAFGLFKGFNSFFIVFSIIVIAAILYLVHEVKNEEKLVQFSIGLALGGTVGNLMDRIAYGAVIDFLDFRVWPVFNVADSAVTIGILLLVVLLWRK